MPNEVEAEIGCPKCRTLLFRLERAPIDDKGHLHEHKLVKLGEQDDHLRCATCGTALSRLPHG